jgi:hypothetical protein
MKNLKLYVAAAFLLLLAVGLLVGIMRVYGVAEIERYEHSFGRLSPVADMGSTYIRLLEWNGREFLVNSHGGIIEVTK